MKRTLVKISLTGMLSFIIVGCGYALRGTEVESSFPSAVSLQCDLQTDRDLCVQLIAQMKSSGILVEDGMPLILEVTSSRFQKRAVALQPGGNAAEFRLSFVVDYALKHAQDSESTITRQIKQIEQHHYFLNNELNILGKAREEDDAKARLTALISRRIVNQLSVQANHNPAEDN